MEDTRPRRQENIRQFHVGQQERARKVCVYERQQGISHLSKSGPNLPEAGENMLVAYRYLNFISHSCLPNCRLTDCGYDASPRWKLRTLVPIIGQKTEPNIDYDDVPQSYDTVITSKTVANLIDPVETRHEGFEEDFQFVCTCEACENPKATDGARRTIRLLRRKLMNGQLSAQDDRPGWEEWAAKIDIDMERYIGLCKAQHLFPEGLKAHERATTVYASYAGEADGGEELNRSESVKYKKHIYGQIEMRRLLYGLWDPEVQRPMKTIAPKDQAAKKASKRKR